MFKGAVTGACPFLNLSVQFLLSFFVCVCACKRLHAWGVDGLVDGWAGEWVGEAGFQC